MRKYLKPILIAFLSVLLLSIASISFALWFVFTPERISPVVNNQAQDFFDCQVGIGKVEFTFFSTFPRLGLSVENFNLLNPFPGAPSDTLVNVDRLIGVFDAGTYFRKKQIVLSDIRLENGTINAYVNKEGNLNFDVFVTDTSKVEEPETEFQLGFLDTGVIEFRNINLSYIDDTLKIHSRLQNLFAEIHAQVERDRIESRIHLQRSNISFVWNGESYLSDAEVTMMVPSEIVPSRQKISLQEAMFSVDGLGLMVDGTLVSDTPGGDIDTDIVYSFSRWPFSDILELIPPPFLHYFDGMDLDGIITSEGNIKGIYNDTIMPWLDIHFTLGEGKFLYDEYPIPLSELAGEVNIYTNLKDNDLSYVKVKGFSGKTPESDFSTKGTIKKLFTDIHADLATDANLLLNEFNPFIPDSLNASLKGRLKGQVITDFTMRQLQSMDLDRIKISGQMAASDLDVSLDSIWARTDKMQLAFALPNQNASSSNTRFALADIGAVNLWAGTPDGQSVHLVNAGIAVETSDVRDTTRIPDLFIRFAMDSLAASIDTMQLALRKPEGSAVVNPGKQNLLNPEIKLVYSSETIHARMGDDLLTLQSLVLDTDIVNDESESDIFLQWLVKGFMEMEGGVIESSALTHTIGIPSIKMDFEPERLDVKHGRMIIDQSDFELSGLLVNMLSYFRGDSILRGDFKFSSQSTDVVQLMNLTNGLGAEQEEKTEDPDPEMKEKDDPDKENTDKGGPYIVPQGIDFLLTTDIKHATFGVDTARNITGQVRVYDGILLLDDLKFITPAAGMQLTAMYRTPRKNHLFLGMDYHMFDIEIERLLKMIPDIDTLMPMLRSFKGKGEFHLAVETYLDSLYNVKKSTLRGASSIQGENLVLMDGETFSEIARTLRFSHRAENRVDSLSAEFTIFREEIDIYPFLIVMDRYKAVVGGRHNFDLSFNYHISVVDSPVPMRFGIDVTGDMDDINYNPTQAKYAEFYRPASRRAVENRQLELRRMIRENLTNRLLE